MQGLNYSDNVEVSDISETSVVVSWTIEYVLEQQEYFLVYGVDEDALHLTSSSVLGHSDISLTNQAYNITLTGLTIGTDYYVAVIAEYGFTFLYSDTISFTTHDRRKMRKPFLLLYYNPICNCSSTGTSPKLQGHSKGNWTVL